jgi:hypothetical protein
MDFDAVLLRRLRQDAIGFGLHCGLAYGWYFGVAVYFGHFTYLNFLISPPKSHGVGGGGRSTPFALTQKKPSGSNP